MGALILGQDDYDADLAAQVNLGRVDVGDGAGELALVLGRRGSGLVDDGKDVVCWVGQGEDGLIIEKGCFHVGHWGRA